MRRAADARARLGRRIAVTVLSALVMAGCGAGTPGPGRKEGAPRRAARLTIAVARDRGPLNLFAGADEELAELVYDKLLAPNPYVDAPQPWLAEEVRQVDAVTWEARVRQGVTWHDDRPFTADDVRFTFEYFKRAPTGRWTHHVSEVPAVESVTVDGAFVRFRCSFPCPDLGPVTLADLPIIPRHVWEGVDQPRQATALPVGTGPYRLVAHSPTAGYRFRSNPRYFAGAPLVDELVMPVIPDPSATFTALRTGQIDAAARVLPPELVDEFRRERGVSVVTTRPLRFLELRLNFRRPPFDRPEFRRAVSRAVDRRDLLSTVLLGRGRPADKGYPHPDSPWTNPRLSTPGDAGEARRLLDGLGLVDRDGDGVRQRPDRTPLAFSIKVTGSEPTHLRAAELITEQLAAVGLRATVQALDAAGVEELFRSRDFDMAVGEIGPHGVADPTQFIVSHRSGYLWQAPSLPYPEWDVLFERWKATTTPADRKAALFEMQELFNRQPTSVPLFYPDEHWAFRPTAWKQWAESPGQGIVHKWSFLPAEVASRAGAITRSPG